MKDRIKTCSNQITAFKTQFYVSRTCTGSKGGGLQVTVFTPNQFSFHCDSVLCFSCLHPCVRRLLHNKSNKKTCHFKIALVSSSSCHRGTQQTGGRLANLSTVFSSTDFFFFLLYVDFARWIQLL